MKEANDIAFMKPDEPFGSLRTFELNLEMMEISKRNVESLFR